MAYNSWEFYRRYDNNNDIRSDPSGASILNSSLSDPLVSSGDYCRSWYGSSGGFDSKLEFRTFLTDSSYVNPPLNTAISMRAKVRIEEVTTDSKTGISRPFAHFVGVSAYSGYPTVLDQGGATAGYGDLGYVLALQKYRALGTGGTLGHRLVILAGTTYSPNDFFSNPDSHIVATCSGSYVADIWYDIRFDIIPTSLTSRTLNAYTSSNGGSSWDEVGSYSFTNVSPLWRSDGKTGFFNTFALDGAWSPDTFVHYIDDFKINIDTVA